jgi:hypothetical protein
MRIKQVHMGEHDRYSSFKDFYSLENYTDINKPVVFYGLNNNRDLKKWIKHKGFKIYLPAAIEELGGWGGIREGGYLYLDKINLDDLNVIVQDEVWEYLVKASGVKNCKKVRFTWRDHRMCKPTPLGDKIYIHFGHYPEIDETTSLFQKDRFLELLGDDLIYPDTFIPYEDLVENYFNKSFLHIVTALHPTQSETTTQAMGLMGRKTLSTWPNLNPSCEVMGNTDELLRKIKLEKKKIGTIQSELANEVKNFFDFSDDWLYTEYWE